MEIWKFKTRQVALNYIKFQIQNGNTMKDAKVRMRKYPGHEWANRVNNVPVIQVGEEVLGDRYLFIDGVIRPECFESLSPG